MPPVGGPNPAALLREGRGPGIVQETVPGALDALDDDVLGRRRLAPGTRPVTTRIIGVPMDLGANAEGSCLGPQAVRIAGLSGALRDLGHGVRDAGDVHVPLRCHVRQGSAAARYLDPISEVCTRIYGEVRDALHTGQTPLILGGDHSLAAGSIAAVADVIADRGGRLGVVWIDAHGDMNCLATSPTGNVHGMPLACLLGYGPPVLSRLARHWPALRPADVALVGVRALDAQEAARVRRIGVHHRSVEDLKRGGDDDVEAMRSTAREVVDTVLAHCTHIHVSFDVDGLDPDVAPGVGTPEEAGLSGHAVRVLLEALSDSGRVCSADLVEVNPIFDERNRTARLAVDLISALFGRRPS